MTQRFLLLHFCLSWLQTTPRCANDDTKGIEGTEVRRVRLPDRGGAHHAVNVARMMVLLVATIFTSFFTAVIVPMHLVAQSDTASFQRISFDDLSLDADKPLYLRYGLFGSFNLTYHNPLFAQTGNCPTCLVRSFDPGNFELAIGRAIGGGLLAEFPILNRLGVAIRASYYTSLADANLRRSDYNYATQGVAGLATTFVADETILAAAGVRQTPGMTNTMPENFTSQHRMNLQLGILSAEPMVTYRPLDALTLYFGAQIGVFLQRRFEYLEIITNPNDIVWRESGSAIRGERVGDFQTNSVALSVIGGVGYEIPLNSTGTILFAPEAFFMFGGTPSFPLLGGWGDRSQLQAVSFGSDGAPVRNPDRSVALTEGSWYANNLRIAAAIKYSPYRTIRPELTPEIQETLRKVKKLDSLVAEERKQNARRLQQLDSANRVISAKVEELKKIGISVDLPAIVAVDDSGRETGGGSAAPTVTIEQFRTQTTQPLLAAVYFDDNSSVLPSRYRRVRTAERNNFKISDVAGKSNVELYRHVLNIVGQRMNENPAAVLFLTGTNSGLGAEKDNIKLSEQRAIAVSDYLQDVWRIPAKRIIIQKQNLPDKPAGSDPNGAAENRRVEMSSNLPEIFDAVKTDQVSRIADPPTLRFKPIINAGAGLKQWALELTQFVDNEAVTLKTFEGTSTPPTVLDWNLNKEPSTMPVSGQDITVQLTMTDVNNKNGDAPLKAISVRQILVERKEVEGKPDKRIDSYDIIGFEATSVTPDENGQRVIDAIKKALKPNSTVIVTGYTDATGDATKDNDVAKRRAETVAKALGVPGVSIRSGGGVNVNDNALPEGRAYNRYVHVEVQTPIR
jgi:outer membrane protein OmpA-like peptidoglycan-associated protein